MSEQDKSALPVGTVVRGYRLLDVLGSGGFGVTYMAEDSETSERVAVKEYLPIQFAVRDGTTVHPKSEASRADFVWGLDRFLSEAGMLTRFRHPNIVQVKGYFEANNTAYIVMKYEEGEPLDKLLDRRGKLTEAQLKRVLLPIADGLRQVHARGVWHRDVKPANIFVRRSNESPVLLDFGAARNALGARSASMTAIVSPPYAPPEQYDSLGELGAYTDVYALSALCWRAITGELPAESPYRQRLASKGRDPLPLLAETRPPGYSSALLHAVDWGLRLDEDERPQSVAEWLDAMGEIEEHAALDPSPAQAMPSEPDPPPPARSDSPSSAEPEHVDAEVQESAHGRYAHLFVSVGVWYAAIARPRWKIWSLATLAMLGVGLLVVLFNGARNAVDWDSVLNRLKDVVGIVDRKAGDRFRDCLECPEMVVIEAGSYWMGSSSHEKGRRDNEGKTHEVMIEAPFAVGKREVTFGQWDACVNDNGCPRGEDIANDGAWGRGQRPVINVNWNDAQSYAEWLSRKTKKSYRLLSESEWEYAARAGTLTAYSWGDEIGVGQANCDGCGSSWDKRTAPAGRFAANEWGLHDMHGNVYEWVEDCWNDSYEGAPSDGSAWLGEDCSYRVVRGGSWQSSPSNLRAANRFRYSSSVRLRVVGFRVARALTR